MHSGSAGAQVAEKGASASSRPSREWPLLPLSNWERRDAFLAALARMTPETRIRRARYSWKAWERQVWVGHYPDEVPLINSEFEWIARRSVDLE
ncbi:MAG: hypothetical protein AB7T48_00990 [Solirubrobacterales bacterium]